MQILAAALTYEPGFRPCTRTMTGYIHEASGYDIPDDGRE